MANSRDRDPKNIPPWGESTPEEIEEAEKLGAPMPNADLVNTLEDVIFRLQQVHRTLIKVMPSQAPQVIRRMVPDLERILRDCRGLPDDGRSGSAEPSPSNRALATRERPPGT